MSEHGTTSQVLIGAAGVDQATWRPAEQSPQMRNLQVFIGRWINQGSTIAGPDSPAHDIVTSDIYEWAPGGEFVIHTAYGRIGGVDVGGVEIIGYDPEAGAYRSYFHDNSGTTTVSRLTEHDGVWTWTRQGTRTTATLSSDGRTQTAHHELGSDGSTWEPTMKVTLHKIS